MAEFQRHWVCNGDTTTAGGEVIAPDSRMSVNGKNMACEGDAVRCPACNSTGVIKCVPPLRRTTSPAGTQLSLDGDLCMCNCPNPPRLIASQKQYGVGFGAADIASASGAAAWLSHAGESLAKFGYAFDRVMLLKDPDGNPLANLPYKITLETGHTFEGVTDKHGHTEKVFSTQAHMAKIEAPYYGSSNHTAHTAHGSDTCGC